MTRPPKGEELCKRCGRCCHAKVIVDDEVYYTNIPCEFLDPATRTCTVYDRRFEVNPECLSLEEGLKAGVFPSDCPYAADVAGYRAPHTDCDLDEMAHIYRENT